MIAINKEPPQGLFAHVRLCCGKRHDGPVCADEKVMCCLCFNRFSQDELNVNENGNRENVCMECAAMSAKPYKTFEDFDELFKQAESRPDYWNEIKQLTDEEK